MKGKGGGGRNGAPVGGGGRKGGGMGKTGGDLVMWSRELYRSGGDAGDSKWRGETGMSTVGSRGDCIPKKYWAGKELKL